MSHLYLILKVSTQQLIFKVETVRHGLRHFVLTYSDLSRRRPCLRVLRPAELGPGRRPAPHVRRHEGARPLAGRLAPHVEPRRRKDGEMKSLPATQKKAANPNQYFYPTDFALRADGGVRVFPPRRRRRLDRLLGREPLLRLRRSGEVRRRRLPPHRLASGIHQSHQERNAAINQCADLPGNPSSHMRGYEANA